MATSYFQKLETDAFRAGVQPRSKDSLEWFKQRLKSVSRINNNQILKDPLLKKVEKPLIGRMYMYFYDPKTKDTLPYYDRFPLIVMVGKEKGGFTGLNLHYLPPILRAKFFDRLSEFTNNKKYDESTRFRLTYNFLRASSKLELFKPCFKRYLTSQVESRITEVPATEWEVALFLPTDKFVKNSRQSVWKKSRAMI
jgi:hypothetical protein|tara:strand:+ start:49 stop:636 length:588 start_codon:yes stop_codon:yes gene_type:complete